MSTPTPTPVPSTLPLDDVMARHRAQHEADRAATQPHRAEIAALPTGGERKPVKPLPGHPGTQR